MRRLKYKVGDRVKIQSLERYNQYKNRYGDINYGCETEILFTSEMSSFCGQVVTITRVRYIGCVRFYHLAEDKGVHLWVAGMFEGLVEEETKPEPKFKIGEVVYVIDYDTDLKIQNRIYKNGMWNYIINIESAPFIFYDNELKKKKEYPKTYEECCKIMGIEVADLLIWDNMLDPPETIYYNNLERLLHSFRKLLICRDAYWKIAGEEIGLGEPWEPDWNASEPKYVIACTSNGIEKQWGTTYCKGFAFPTSEMRDAFYENFKELIKQCKELL